MKKKFINFLILVFVGICTYFAYEKFFGCDKQCSTPCKDSVIVAPVKQDSNY
jgi:hypothetical protein